MTDPPRVTLYTRKGCHLCDEAKQVLRAAGLTVEEVDIDQDPGLQARYNNEVPVVFLNGRKAFKYRVDAKDLQRRLRKVTDGTD
jgi:glutaredoxin